MKGHTVKSIIAALLTLAVATPATAKNVLFDQGGSIMERRAEIRELILTKEPVQIIGTCASSCTMYLTVAGSCVHPNAYLMFHGPNTTAEHYVNAVRLVAAHYPVTLRNWYLTDGHTTETTMTGAQLIADHGVKSCEG